MARNRVIYQSQALFIAPSSTGVQVSGVSASGLTTTNTPFTPLSTGSLGSGISLLKKMDRIQNCNFNFTINRGEKIAIIGASGCGKSTLSKLLVNILSPTEGNITIDNVNICNYDRVWLKKQIGYVAQDSILFTDTIANNISYGLDIINDVSGVNGVNGVNEDDIIEAAKNANAHEFISNLPNKYQTKLEGTELSSLSGGQKQRISIARTLIRKPQIIIFDEATSALDPYCEEIVQQTIKNCCSNKNTTMIIIAHRMSALELADTIYELKGSLLCKM